MIPSGVHPPSSAASLPPPPPPPPNPSPTFRSHPFSQRAAGILPDEESAPRLGRVRLSDIALHDGAPERTYLAAVECLSGSLTRHNAAVVELGVDDAAVLRCALESARVFFRARAQGGKPARGACTFRAGRASEDGDMSPPCMSDAFRCMGKVSRAALSAIARHLHLRSDAFNHLLDDSPLPCNVASSSLLVVSQSYPSLDNGKGAAGCGKSATKEMEKGMLTLIASDCPGIQVCDPNGRWYLADGGLGPGELLLLTGRSLGHVTAGLRPAASYKVVSECGQGIRLGGRASLTFKLMPQGNATLDCSSIAAAGHVIPQSLVPISVSQFMDDLLADEDAVCNHQDIAQEVQNHLIKEPSLRSILSDPLSGAFLEDAVVISCGHSFGGLMLKKVIEMARCTLCSSEIELDSFVPNYALRDAASAVKYQDDRRLFHNAMLRKRRKEAVDHMDSLKRVNKDNGELGGDGDSLRSSRGVQYPFQVNEKVTIKGNRRTPDKFVGREAIIASQCLNGWCWVLRASPYFGDGENFHVPFMYFIGIFSRFLIVVKVSAFSTVPYKRSVACKMTTIASSRCR